jgi:peptidoglycan/LPS O-acetylase OafA/YrhL
VPLFFALSAFSLLYGYSSRLFEAESLQRFYVRRLFRILPLFYVMLAIYVCLEKILGSDLSNSEILLNITFLFPFLPGKHESIVWAGWSLGVEWLFYATFPIFALLARRITLSAVAFILLIVVAMAFAGIYWQLRFDPTYKANERVKSTDVLSGGGVCLFACPASWLDRVLQAGELAWPVGVGLGSNGHDSRISCQ